MDDRSKELERLYEATWQRVKEVVNGSDPEGLLALGFPDDEYDDAVREITRRLLKGEPTDEMTLSQWFESQYGARASVAELVEHLSPIAADLRGQGDP